VIEIWKCKENNEDRGSPPTKYARYNYYEYYYARIVFLAYSRNNFP